LGISKTPVHEALLELSYKGFIEIIPKKGFKLKDLTRKDIDDIYAFRLALEKFVVTNVVEKVGKKQLNYLQTILLNLKNCEDVMQFMEEDIRFHRYLAMRTENQQIIISLNRIWDLCVWIGFRTLSIKNSLDSVLEEHFHLLRCIEKKDQKSAEESIEKHIASSLSKIYNSGKWNTIQFSQMGFLGEKNHGNPGRADQDKSGGGIIVKC